MNFAEDITIHLQPIFDTYTNKVKYAEVLLRPISNQITTYEILKLVKEQGLEIELDKYILRKACETIKDIPNKKLRLTVNLSVKTLEKQGVFEELISIIDESGINTWRCILEINEETEFDNIVVMDNVKGFVHNKVVVALDDLGQGNASMKYISKFPIEIVKFDKVYLYSGNIKLRDSINYYHKFGIDTVIEGIETIEELERVKEVGFGNIQGFLLGKPVKVGTYKILYI